MAMTRKLCKDCRKPVVISFALFLMTFYIFLHSEFYDNNITKRNFMNSNLMKLFLSDLNKYPINTDLKNIVENLQCGRTVEAQPLYTLPLFPYSLDSANGCEGNNPFLLLLVKSATNNFDKRQTIRNTWGNENLISGIVIRTRFLVGLPDNNEQNLKNQDLRDEHAKYGDLIQQKFVDAYFNNTVKVLMGLDWIQRCCSKASYIIFADDDVYISTVNLVNLLQMPQMQSMKYVYSGYMDIASEVKRSMSNKWYISEEDYSPILYPPYIHGLCVIMNQATARDFALGAPYTKMFKIDDTYLGIVAWRLGIQPLYNDNVYNPYRLPDGKLTYEQSVFQHLIATHGSYTTKELQQLFYLETKRIKTGISL